MRYSRQEIFSKIGKKGQEILLDSRIAIIGLGAIGSVCAELLTRAGIGNLIIVDRDLIELSNLQRQSLYDEDGVGKSKAIQAKEKLSKINSGINIKAFPNDLNFENINEIIGKVDLVLDCTDNLDTRFLINEYSLKKNIPWIYGGAIEDRGFVLLIKPGKFCFRCIFNEASNLDTCDTIGVLNTITHSIASIQVNEAIKYLLNEDYEGELIKFDIWNNELKKFKVKRKENCLVCKGNFEYLNGKKGANIIKFCSSGNYQIRNGNIDLNKIKSRLINIGKTDDLGYCLRFNNMFIFKDRTLIKAKSEEEAKSLYSKYIGN
ncbi:MAG: ThiF family adenylyltransferase [Nanoarchaeota archaeon]